MSDATAPIALEYDLRCSPEDAFAAYTGRIGEWSGLAHTFTLAQDRRHPSEVAVEFVPGGDGCAVRFAHGGWTDANSSDRKKFGDWPVLLDRFAALAATASD